MCARMTIYVDEGAGVALWARACERLRLTMPIRLQLGRSLIFRIHVGIHVELKLLCGWGGRGEENAGLLWDVTSIIE